MEFVLNEEWNELLEKALPFAKCERGARELERLLDPEFWAKTKKTAERLQQETKEIYPLLDKESLWGCLDDLTDPEPQLEALEKGRVLDAHELWLLRRWALAIDQWSTFPLPAAGAELLAKDLRTLPDVRSPLQTIDRVLEGEFLRPNASPLYASLLQEKFRLRDHIQKQMENLFRKYEQAGVLQDKTHDILDGRYLLPIRIGAQAEVEGEIFGSSVSRQTVYIEPAELNELNRKIRQNEAALNQETFRILEAVCNQIKDYKNDIFNGVLILSAWDCVQCKAKLASVYGGKPILFQKTPSSPKFQIRGFAHPLLFWTEELSVIQRNDLIVEADRYALLITGPNTGGKTVFLKALGLLSYFSKTGFFIPAESSPTMPWFDFIFADIGDPQSIHSHLSSFSGHIARFCEILEHSTENSLVLLDELNSATDPEEGAALGRAILETLLQKGAFVVATTHDPKLKLLSIEDPRILSASIQFDEETAKPTYKIITGIPGSSHAFETAERLGLPPHVLKLAKHYVGTNHLEVENAFEQIRSQSEKLKSARLDAERKAMLAEKARLEFEEKYTNEVKDLVENTKKRLKRTLEELESEWRSQMRSSPALLKKRATDADQWITQADERIRQVFQETFKSSESVKDEIVEATQKVFKVGDYVRIPKWKGIGAILEIDARHERLKVNIGKLPIVVNFAEAFPSEPPAADPAPKKKKSHSAEVPAKPAETLDLRGIRFEEAMTKLETYIDQAFRCGLLAQVTVIHGYGTGALREGTRSFLKQLNYITEYRDGAPSEGGSGATVVLF